MVLSSFLQGMFLLCISIGFGLESAIGALSENESDQLALLDFKNLITDDPLRFMSSWNDSIHFCKWVGVSCSPSNGRVLRLNLESQSLVGSLPPSVGNLTLLTGLNLVDNSFHGELPQEMGRLLQLQLINLSYNSFTGRIPSNLTHCTELRRIDLKYNKLTGDIPDQLSSLSKLHFLGIGGNNITGKIPPWIGNFSSLSVLSLIRNNLQGSIPSELGKLKVLFELRLYGNNLSGTIPSSIFNISTIAYFTVTQNQLHGELPPDVGLKLPRLRLFAGGVNSFTGSIPISLLNASRLQLFDVAQNGLTGTIPKNLGILQSLVRFNVDDNMLGNGKNGDLDFISSLVNCTVLKVLGFSGNRLGGKLPNCITNLSTMLQILTTGRNNLIHGTIPPMIHNLVNLNLLGMEENDLSGNVPDVMGKLQNLEGLFLSSNRFSGTIPSSLGNLTRLTQLFMERNQFEGIIPSSLGKCQALQTLNLSYNKLNGTISKQIFTLSFLSISLFMSHNSLTGSLPAEVGNLTRLVELDVSGNKLSSEIPNSLGSCVSLGRLHLEGNKFEGTIPKSFRNLEGLQDLDLSSNNLSGTIPNFLTKFASLKYLNLSYNNFEGEVPREGVFENASAFFIAGNNELCGGIQQLNLPACSRKRNFKVVIIVSIVVAFVILLLCLFSAFYIRRHAFAPSSNECQANISYLELEKSTTGFSAENVIGSGGFGSVYKGVLPGDGRIVAIKVLNLQHQGAAKSFFDECNALRSIRHRNLLKVITVCSSIDRQGNDFKALVFEFMSNGSLDLWLHPRVNQQQQSKRLTFIQRLNIAIDVAFALEYLHQSCEPPIVHRDLKPSNVLLDEDMIAHVGDFGLARFLYDESQHPAQYQSMTVGLKGSVGYIPPEYGLGNQASALGDIYSYGILLLEMFTAKRPTDVAFTGDQSIHNFVAAALPEHVMAIIDPLMPIEEENIPEEQDHSDGRASTSYSNASPENRRVKIEECLVSVMRIGLSCSAESPRDRMDINLALSKLKKIKQEGQASDNRRVRHLIRNNNNRRKNKYFLHFSNN